MREDFRLCYVDDSWAWFTSDIEKAWGDDWNDAPHYCNAGDPYEDRGVEFVKVAWDSPLLECFGTAFEKDSLNVGNGWFSVEQFNNREAPWLCQITYGTKPCSRQHEIWAGTSLAHFRKEIADAGGQVYEA